MQARCPASFPKVLMASDFWAREMRGRCPIERRLTLRSDGAEHDVLELGAALVGGVSRVHHGQEAHVGGALRHHRELVLASEVRADDGRVDLHEERFATHVSVAHAMMENSHSRHKGPRDQSLKRKRETARERGRGRERERETDRQTHR